eukprot:EST41836.1 Dual specificity phosphatase [Spironucleus salmonicida]
MEDQSIPQGNSICPVTLYKAENLPEYIGPFILPDLVDFLLQTLNIKQKFNLITPKTDIAIANSVFFAGAYSLFSGVDINQVIGITNTLQPIGFRDATPGISHYQLLCEDLLWALHRALTQKVFNLQLFNIELFRQYYTKENGLISIVIPNKIFALPSPISESSPLFSTWPFTPQQAIKELKSLNVTAIVRLNESLYNKVEFVRNGIHHYDLPYPDGSNPSDEIVEKFLKICYQEPRVAVHCRVGLGRTGTMIGLLLMQQYKFTAREAIAWLRLVRPGAVLGGQQQYLCIQEGRHWNIQQRQDQLHKRESQTSDEVIKPKVVKRAAASRIRSPVRKVSSPIRSSQLIGLPNIRNYSGLK